MWLRRPSREHGLSLLIFLLLCSVLQAKKHSPRVTKTKFDNAPANLFYFDDTDTLLVQDKEAGNVYRSTDAGETWRVVDDIREGQAWDLWQHPYDNRVAYVLGIKHTHWVTRDQGNSWHSFDIDALPTRLKAPLSFHADDSDKVLFHGRQCKEVWHCKGETYYTTDGFETSRRLRRDTLECVFAHSTPLFKTDEEDLNHDRILCAVQGKYSSSTKDNRLVISDNYFDDETEPNLEGGRTVQGVISMAVVKKYLVVAAKAEKTDELALYVTDDTKTWHRAVFPHDHRLEEGAYTILESTNYSIQVDVMTTRAINAMGVLFTSNSNGTYFTRNIEHTNRNFEGLVDFEKVQGIQGIVLVNVVDNWKDVEESPLETKLRQTKISFDDGRTWQALTVGKKDLHLHSVTDLSNSGRVFSSPAPGLVMGIGNSGGYLRSYEEGDLYVSDDAGLTWEKAPLEGPQKYEFGDQGSILVSIYDGGPTSKISYSINHGKDWKTADLGESVRAGLLTTTPDSTSLKFVLVGMVGKGSDTEFYIFSLDFEGLHERKCDDEDKDFEKWYARRDEDGNPDCLMGHKQYYRRRKADADCFIDEEFKDPQPQSERCVCTAEDFECDYNFIRSDDGKECLPVGKMTVPEGECKNVEDKYTGSSGFRLIPGNDCDRKGGVNLDEEIERSCADTVKAPVSGKVVHELTKFRASNFKEYYYLERTETSEGQDETVVMRTDEQEIFISHDHGKTWEQILKNEDITSIYPHQYFNDVVFFLTGTTTVHYSTNRGEHIHSFDAPEKPNQDNLQIIGFHPDYKDWLLWTGAVDCNFFDSSDCHSVAYVTQDRGDNWRTMLRYVRKCEFIKREGRGESEELVYCEQFQDEKLDGNLQLLSSDNWFAESTVHFDDIIDFATMSEFIIVAAKDSDQKSLKVDASVDGKTFADALFPPNFNVPVQKAYTVLDSSTHSVFLHVTVNSRAEFEYGSIVKSNSNGTSYVLSLNGVNRNTPGYVDFEKMQGLEGVALVNVVDNLKDAERGQAKKLKTMITHNDGAEWALIQAPEKDAEGVGYGCNSKDSSKCSLHLHGYTERKDPRDTFSSPSAVGLMIGVGNVGEYLGRKPEADTFITRDGGIEWHAVKKGSYMWEYGDQGSIIIIVEENAPTDVVFYSRDEGFSWQEYKFSDSKVQIEDISTVPSDNSRNFLLWGRDSGGRTGDLITVNLDFTGLTDRKCDLDEENPNDENGDYYIWEPRHPLQDSNCLFGHVAQYHRKKLDSDCYNGKQIQHLHNIAKNCSCTRQDFECDYNYERQSDGSCGLVPGLEPADHSKVCLKDPNTIEYYEPTGYRKIPLDTCSGGRELEFSSTAHPCPGKKEQFEKKRGGLGSAGLFFAITIPTSVAAGAGYWVWRNWDGKFGRIRLGEAGGVSLGSFNKDSPWIVYPVAALSALVAVLSAIPLLASSLWRSVSSRFGRGQRYTTRSSFARSRGNYAVVDPDEDELLGDDDDEDV